MQILLVALSIVLAYLLGSIPVGVLAGRLLAGVEVLQIGSGHTGATNVYRVAGPLGLAVTSLGDILKGILAVWIARLLMLIALFLGVSPALLPWIEALAGIAAVAGHNWSLFLGFRGGAGTVTTLGVLAALNVYVAVAVAVLGLAAIAISRTASIGSITVALAMGPALAIAAAVGSTYWAYVPLGIVSGAFTVYALLPNIKRLLDGRERQLKVHF